MKNSDFNVFLVPVTDDFAVDVDDILFVRG